MISWKQPLGTYPQPAQPSEFGDHNYTYFWRGTLTKRRSRRERTTSTLAKGVSPVNHMAFLLNIDVTLYEAYVICSICRWLWRAIFRDTVHNDPSQAHTNQCKVKEKPGQNSDRLLSNIVNGSFTHMWMTKPNIQFPEKCFILAMISVSLSWFFVRLLTSFLAFFWTSMAPARTKEKFPVQNEG